MAEWEFKCISPKTCRSTIQWESLKRSGNNLSLLFHERMSISVIFTVLYLLLDLTGTHRKTVSGFTAVTIFSIQNLESRFLGLRGQEERRMRMRLFGGTLDQQLYY